MKTSKNFIFTAISACVLLILGAFYAWPRLMSHFQEPIDIVEAAATTTGIKVPLRFPNIPFNTTTTIPETSVRFAYPKKGFFDLGVRISKEAALSEENNFLGAVSIGPNVAPDQDEPIRLTVSAYKVNKSEVLTEAIAKGVIASIPLDPAYKNGVYSTFNGHEYFMYAVSSGLHNTWIAFALGHKEIVSVSMTMIHGEGVASPAVSEYDEHLFQEILSHLSFD